MPILASAFFIVSIIFFGIGVLLAIPVVPASEPWKGLPVLLGFFFLAMAEFIARGGLT